MTDGFEEHVRALAGDACEYCCLPQAASQLRFVLHQVTPRGLGGVRAVENLALCCGRCNRHKAANVSGIDPQSGVMTRLFHPRRDGWSDHFRWEDVTLVGVSPIGRATVAMLAINHPSQITVRDLLRREGA